MQHKDSNWEFSSGQKRYAHTEKLGVSFNECGEPEVGYGSDGGFWMPGEDQWKPAADVLSQRDLLEIAENQIQRWQRFAEWVRSR